MTMVKQRHGHDRKLRCDGIRCPHYAEYQLQGRSHALKLCHTCAEQLATALCEFGHIHRQVSKHFQCLE